MNAARDERLRAFGARWPFILDGLVFTLPVELPRGVARNLKRIADDDVEGLLKLLMGDDQYARFETHDLTMQDLAALLEAYGRDTRPGDSL